MRRSLGQERTRRRCIARQRLTRMVLDPLAEVRIRMLVAVVIGRGQLVVDLERRSKRRHGQQKTGHDNCQETSI